MTETQRTAFTQLLTAWKRHDELRHDPTVIRELAASRKILDDARLHMARSRAHAH